MLADDVRRGLEARPRWLPPKYFYDHAGSVLFERITELPEYYLTRVEEVVIRDVAPEVMRRVRPREIVELGPGSCRKVRFLYDVIGGRNDVRYVPDPKRTRLNSSHSQKSYARFCFEKKKKNNTDIRLDS